MHRWFTTAANTPRFTEPETQFVRFVADNYYKVPHRSDINFLELGSGSGGDLKFLIRQGFVAIGVDAELEAYANFHVTFDEYFMKYSKNLVGAYDCVYELNVLCHVEEPPYHAIAEVLKPGGKFFAIMPASDTEADLEGKGFTRLSTPFSIRTELANIFSQIDIGPYTYWHRKRHYRNWIVEADK